MARLGDVFECQITGEWGNECAENEIGTKVLRTTNFTPEGRINYGDVVVRSISESKVEKKRLHNGDIILEKSGGTEKTPVGRVVFCDESIEDCIYLCNNFTQAMRVNQAIAIPQYVFYCMWNLHYSGRTDLLQNKTTGIRNLQVKSYLNESCPLPSIDEQRKIAAVLDKVSDLIAKRRQQLDKLDEMVKARFVEMFGTLHDSQSMFPVVSIEDVCSLIKDGTHQTPQYTDDVEHGFKFLSSKDVMTQRLSLENIKYIPAELHDKLYAVIQPKRNDILMSKNGVNYGVAAVNDTDEIFDIYVSLALLRPTEKINPVYLRCVINNPDTKRQFDSSIKGIGVPNLHLSEIKKTKILLPPMNMQNQFSAFVEQTEKSKTTISRSLEKLETLKKALMQEYFG